jgi:hypothetical protein
MVLFCIKYILVKLADKKQIGHVKSEEIKYGAIRARGGRQCHINRDLN